LESLRIVTGIVLGKVTMSQRPNSPRKEELGLVSVKAVMRRGGGW
jgi:hypothetical protein